MNSPLATITQGITNAITASLPTIFVAGTVNGATLTYVGDITVPAGKSLLGKYTVIATAGGNTWARNGAVRTQLTNSMNTGVKFAAGAGPTTIFDGFDVRPGGAGSPQVGITITNASPTVSDFAVTPGLSGGISPAESIGVRVSGSALSPANPILRGSPAGVPRSVVTAGSATTRSIGLETLGATIDSQNVNYLGGQAAGAVNAVTAGVWVVNATGSFIRDANFRGGRSPTCLGAYFGGQLGNVLVQTVDAEGCPNNLTTAAATGTIGIAFDACPVLAGVSPPQVNNSVVRGGAAGGANSFAIGVMASDGCDPTFNGVTATGHTAGGTTLPATSLGAYCTNTGIVNANGANAPCRVINSTITAGNSNQGSAIGMACFGSCYNGGLLCPGSCSEINNSTISAPGGATMTHLLLSSSSPTVNRNRIGAGANGATCASSSATPSVSGLVMQNSRAMVTNNFIVGGPCQIAVGVANESFARDGGFVPAPTVQNNTIVATISSFAPSLNASSIGLQLSSNPGTPAGPRGIYRNNIIQSGPVSSIVGTNIVVRENTAGDDPATFWNNLLFASGAVFPTLYLDEGMTAKTTAAEVNGMVDTSILGNIAGDPIFVTPNLDFHITGSGGPGGGSPARAAGNATGAPNVDIDGQNRPNPFGSNPDIGADEIP